MSADIQRPADQYRGRYEFELDEALNLFAGAPVIERGIHL